MDQALVPGVLAVVALVVAWILYDQRYGFRRRLAAIRRAQGPDVANAIEEEARHLMAEGRGEPAAYALAIEKQMQHISRTVKAETERSVRASGERAAVAHEEGERQRAEARQRLLVKHGEGIIPGQGPAKRDQTPPPEPKKPAKGAKPG
jgi:hypothetical protein